MTRNHVMIDLETLGNDYDGVFTAIGAVYFDPDTAEIIDTIHLHIDWESQLQEGRTITPDTVVWWFNQTKEAQQEVVFSPAMEVLSIHHALAIFRNWLPYEPIVWGNGPNFDIGKLEHAYGYGKAPWGFKDVRCVKTIRDLCSSAIDKDDIKFEGEKHNALNDATHQAKYVSAMWQLIKAKVKQ